MRERESVCVCVCVCVVHPLIPLLACCSCAISVQLPRCNTTTNHLPRCSRCWTRQNGSRRKWSTPPFSTVREHAHRIHYPPPRMQHHAVCAAMEATPTMEIKLKHVEDYFLCNSMHPMRPCACPRARFWCTYSPWCAPGARTLRGALRARQLLRNTPQCQCC